MNLMLRRDFPPDQIPPLSAISGTAAAAEGQRSDMASYLNPWLARHAVLVCSTVKVPFGALAHAIDGASMTLCRRCRQTASSAAQSSQHISSAKRRLTGGCLACRR